MTTQLIFDPGEGSGITPRPALVEWLAEEGSEVRENAPLLTYEIDKAVATYSSPARGFLRKRLVPPGARFAPGDALALLSDSLSAPLPPAALSPLPAEKDIRTFDWSEIDNRAGAPRPLGVMRRAIADRMAMSKRHIPSFYLTAAADMTECYELRARMKRTGRRATFNDMAIKASALALAANPRAADVYTPDGLVRRNGLHIGFAAALPDEGLVVPVVQNADALPLREIAARTRALAEKAKNGDLTPSDCAGGVFSVSYLGGYEVDNFIAIVNPGEAAILAVGRTEEKPVVRDGEIVIRPMASLTLSCDHRSMDGALAARLMGDIKRFLEHPEEMQ